MLHHFSYLKASSPSHVTGSAPPPTNFFILPLTSKLSSLARLHRQQTSTTHITSPTKFLHLPMSSLAWLHRQQTTTQHSCFITSPTSKLLHLPMSSLAWLHYYESAFMLHHFSYLKASSPSHVLPQSFFWLSSLARLHRQQTTNSQHSCFITSPQSFFTTS